MYGRDPGRPRYIQGKQLEVGALQRHGTRKPHWVPFPQSTRSRSTSEVERPIPVGTWDGRFRVPVKSVPDWIVVCASEASHLPGGEDRPHVEHLLAGFDDLLGEHVAHSSRFRVLRAAHAPSLTEHLLSRRLAASVRSTPPFGGYGRLVRPGGGPASRPPKREARLEPLRPRTP